MPLKKIRNYSLQNRLTITVGLIFIVAYVSALVITQWLYVGYFEKQFRQHFITLARSIALFPALDGQAEADSYMSQISRILLIEKDVEFVVLYDQQRQISLFKSRKGQVKPEFLTGFIEALDPGNLLEPAVVPYAGRKIIVHPLAVREVGNRPAYVLIGLDDSVFSHLTRKVRYSALGVSVVVLMIGLILLQRFSVRFTRPIKELISSTDLVIDGNFTHQIPVQDEGELGHLSRKFNEMTLKLNYYDKQKSLLNKKLNEYNEKLEEKVRHRKDQLKKIHQEVLSIFHQIPVGLLVVDPHTRVMWYNHELMNIAELPHEEKLSNLNISDIKKFNEIGLAEILSTLCCKTDKQVVQYHLNFSRNKNPKLVEIASQALIREEKQIDGTIFIIKDITREVLLEKKMVQDQRLENIGKIAGGIAHDFNNILAIILPNAQLLKMQLQDRPDWAKYLDTIERAAEQAAALTRKILSFSRGSSHDSFEVISINQVVQDFTKMFRRVLDRKIEIVEHLAGDLWNIKAERTQIEQILMNLSVNSRDAMPEGGLLRFVTENVLIEGEDRSALDLKLKPGKYVSLAIIDTGTGIPQKYQDKIFDPFFSSKKEGQGTGLGLSVVYGITKAHKGVIDVKSRENEGTQFRIFFPVSEEKLEPVLDSPGKLVAGTGTLLIVDDEEMIQQTLKGMLESLNYKVIFANNGRNAINVYKSNLDKIDAVLMDIQMPLMDGVEAATEILKLNPQAKIIFTTGYAEARNFDRLRKMGHQLFLKKPYKITSLADIIQKALSKEIVYN